MGKSFSRGTTRVDVYLNVLTVKQTTMLSHKHPARSFPRCNFNCVVEEKSNC